MSFLDRPQRKNNPIAVLLFLISGIATILFSLNDIVDAYASTKWPKVIGTIVQSEIRIVKDKGTAYCPDISWTYRVQGITYTSTNVPFCESRAKAQAKVARFPYGASAMISYSPKDPGVSTIEPGITKTPPYFILVGAALIVIAIFNL